MTTFSILHKHKHTHTHTRARARAHTLSPPHSHKCVKIIVLYVILCTIYNLYQFMIQFI